MAPPTSTHACSTASAHPASLCCARASSPARHCMGACQVPRQHGASPPVLLSKSQNAEDAAEAVIVALLAPRGSTPPRRPMQGRPRASSRHDAHERAPNVRLLPHLSTRGRQTAVTLPQCQARRQVRRSDERGVIGNLLVWHGVFGMWRVAFCFSAATGFRSAGGAGGSSGPRQG